MSDGHATDPIANLAADQIANPAADQIANPAADPIADRPAQASKLRADNVKPKPTMYRRLRPLLIWLCRIVLGATFVFSGWSKSIDPDGFILKINEYLSAWHIDWLWPQVVDTMAVGLSVVEFTVGVLMLTGCLRRTVTWTMAAFMAVMLPLTAYIYIASPVADCGCFGDAMVISNGATFAKNVVLTVAVVYLLFNNRKASGVFRPITQWLVMIASIFYSLILAFVGITIQPMYDFRPYPVGTALLEDEGPKLRLIYERDGETQSFDLDDLPDSTWTYVGRVMEGSDVQRAFAVFDEGEDVTPDVISTEGIQLLLVVPDPGAHQKARASMANNLNDYISDLGGTMIGIIGAGQSGLDEWRRQASPRFDVYSGDDSVLASLVRGDAGLVYLRDGEVVWKRNLYSFSADFPDFASPDNELDRVRAIETSHYLLYLTVCYIAILSVILMLGMIRVKRKR